MNKKISRMIRIYETKQYDWMGFLIADDNPLTFHHIVKKIKGGVRRPTNGALLTKKAHVILHKIEVLDENLYNEYNYYFKIINDMHRYPSPEVLQMIAYLNERMLGTIKAYNYGYLKILKK